MSDEELDALETAADAATHGPWKATPTYLKEQHLVWRATGEYENEEIARVHVDECWHADDPGYADVCDQATADAAFIALARDAVPALVARIRILEEVLARYSRGTLAPIPQEET